MNLYQLITADWRIRLLAQVTCAPAPRPAARPISPVCVPTANGARR